VIPAPARQRLRVAADVWGDSNLRRLTIAWGAFFSIDSISLVAISVWAFDAAGAGGVALLGVCRVLPGAFALPFGGWAADRFPRRRVAVTVFLTDAVALVGVASAMLADASIGVLAVIVGLSSVMITPYRPAHLALIPLAARSPEQLVAANVVGGAVEGIATLAGPLLAALLLAASGPWVPTLAAAGAGVVGALAVNGLRVASDPSLAMRGHQVGVFDAVARGFGVLWRERDQALIVGCFVTQLFVRGLLSVFLVLIALDLFDLGDSGVGWLTAAIGAGAALGAGIAAGLTGRRRLATPMAVGLVLWGAPIALIGCVPHVGLAALALAVIGLGNSVLDVAGFSLLQRMSDDISLGRVFGAFFTIGAVMAAAGTALAPLLVDAMGLRAALFFTGLVLPAAALVALPRLRRIDRNIEPPKQILDVLLALPLFNELAPTTLEKLAGHCEMQGCDSGTVVVRQGEAGDRVFVLVDGEAEVLVDERVLAELGPGDVFGEIAVMGAGARTATVRIVRPGVLLSIVGRDFVDAINGNAVAWATTSAVVRGRLARGAAGGGTPVGG
jgi:MFS family permease